MKQIFNYHGHTKRCGHASGEDEEFVKEAIANGFKRMGFSDHAPYQDGYAQGERMRKEELEDYVTSIKALQEKYKDQIEIRIGLEFENFEAQHQELQEYRDRFDYMIIGQHGPALYEAEYYDKHSDEDVIAYACFIQQACELGLPDIIAHPDLFMFSKPVWTDACDKAARIICESAQKHHIPLEINLNGLKYGKRQIGDQLRYTYPCREFWLVAQEYEIDVVYGLDAHWPQKYGDLECFRIVDEEILYDIPLHKLEDLAFKSKL